MAILNLLIVVGVALSTAIVGTGVIASYRHPSDPSVLSLSTSVTPSPEPSLTQTPSPTLTPSPTPTHTPSPTPTPRPPTSTPIPSPLPASPAPSPTLSPSPAPTATSTPTPVPQAQFTSAEISALFDQLAGQYHVDPHILRHIAQCESGFNPNAKNGIYGGLYQFSPATWSSFRRIMGLDPNPDLRYNAQAAIETAAYMLSQNKAYHWPNCVP